MPFWAIPSARLDADETEPPDAYFLTAPPLFIPSRARRIASLDCFKRSGVKNVSLGPKPLVALAASAFLAAASFSGYGFDGRSSFGVDLGRVVRPSYPAPTLDIDELSIQAGKMEAEIEKEKYTPTDEELSKLEDELRKLNEEKFGVLEGQSENLRPDDLVVEEVKEVEESSDPEVKRLSYIRSHG